MWSEWPLAAMPGCVLVFTDDGRVVSANHETERITGFTHYELVGKSVELFVAAELSAFAPGARFSSVCRTADDGEIPVEVRVGATEGPRGLRVLTLSEAAGTLEANDTPSGVEAKYRALVEQIAAITYTWGWLGDAYFVDHASPQIEEILGYTADE